MVFLKIGNKIKMLDFFTPIQHCASGSRQSNKAKKANCLYLYPTQDDLYIENPLEFGKTY